jgi:hypothetical protein
MPPFLGKSATIQTMNGSVLNPRKLAVLYYFGDLAYWKLPEIAGEALVGGFDGVALRKLAGLTNVVESDLIPTDIDAAFKEMGIMLRYRSMMRDSRWRPNARKKLYVASLTFTTQQRTSVSIYAN